MEGVVELAEEVFPCRFDWLYSKVKGLSDVVNNPMYSRVGLLLYGFKQLELGRENTPSRGNENEPVHPTELSLVTLNSVTTQRK